MKLPQTPPAEAVSSTFLPALYAQAKASVPYIDSCGDCFDAGAGRLAGPPSAVVPALAWHQRAASWRTRRQLRACAASSNELGAWAHREAAFADHVRQMGLWQSAYWACKQLLAGLCWPRVAASYLLFPAKFAPTQHVDPGQLSSLERLHGIEATHQAVITPDHAVLDGLRLQHPRDGHAPGLLVCLGNGMQFGDAFVVDWLAELASQTQRPVYAYNYRGVGQSVGSLHATGAAVTDVAACIERMAVGGGHDPSDVGVLGISIGGGCGAAAIARLQRQKKVGAEGIGQYAAVHTFRSLPAVLNGLFGRFAGVVTGGLLRLLGNDVLDTEATARRALLAHDNLVLRARADRVVAPSAALGRLAPHAAGDEKRAHRSALFTDVGLGHCDIAPMLTCEAAMALLRTDAWREKGVD